MVDHFGGSFWWITLKMVDHFGGSLWWIILVDHFGGSLQSKSQSNIL